MSSTTTSRDPTQNLAPLGISWDASTKLINESVCDYIKRFTQRKNKLQEVPDSNIINAFIMSVKNETIVRDIGQKKNITVQAMFDLAHEHDDGEDCVNNNNGKYMSCPTDNADPSSSGKKDHKRRGEFITKECSTYKHHIAQEGGKEAAKGNHPSKRKRVKGDEDQGGYPRVEDTMLIFSSLKAYEDHRHQKLKHR